MLWLLSVIAGLIIVGGIAFLVVAYIRTNG